MTSTLGLIAAFMTTAAFVPQALKTIRTHSTKDLSISTYVLMSGGTFMWLVYGYLIKDVPLIGANVLTCLLSSIILYYKLTEK